MPTKPIIYIRGDSLYFDSDAPHGPEELLILPIKLLTVIVGKE